VKFLGKNGLHHGVAYETTSQSGIRPARMVEVDPETFAQNREFCRKYE